MDQILISHEQRLTRLEDKFEVNIGALVTRLEQLEAVQKQAESDREQAMRREQADLRMRLQTAEQGQGGA